MTEFIYNNIMCACVCHLVNQGAYLAPPHNACILLVTLLLTHRTNFQRLRLSGFSQELGTVAFISIGMYKFEIVTWVNFLSEVPL